MCMLYFKQHIFCDIVPVGDSRVIGAPSAEIFVSTQRNPFTVVQNQMTGSVFVLQNPSCSADGWNAESRDSRDNLDSIALNDTVSAATVFLQQILVCSL